MKRALLLCAGYGTRLKPLTDYIPKCLMPIHGRPLLDYWLENLFERCDFDRALINLHYLPKMVESYVKQSRFVNKVDFVYEAELLGTGGTIKANKDFFAGCSDFLVAHADNYSWFSPTAFWEAHQKRPSECIATLLLFETDTPQSCGIVSLDAQNRIIEFHEKVERPPGKLANGAVYIFNREIFNYVEQVPGAFVDLSTQIIPQLMGRLFSFEGVQFHVDIGTIPSWQQAQELFPR